MTEDKHLTSKQNFNVFKTNTFGMLALIANSNIAELNHSGLTMILPSPCIQA